MSKYQWNFLTVSLCLSSIERNMELKLATDCLAVFIDDTGNELLNDPFQKVFGLGGCAVIASQLDSILRHPWREVRRIINGSPEVPLHATDLVNPSPPQINAIAKFFKTQKIPRFGAICSVETDLDHDLSPLFVVAGVLKLRILDILKWQPFRSVEIIFEHSQRLAPKTENVFSNFNIEEDGNPISVGLSWMEKSSAEPALEVADFLVNAIGTEVRHRLAKRPGHAKNFEAFFQHVDDHLVSFIEINRATKS
jgi:hypothetical protein